MGDVDVEFNPGALTGAMIAGGFGIAWGLWGASGLSNAVAAPIRVAAIVIGVLIVLCGALLQGRARRAAEVGRGAAAAGTSGSLFSSARYRRVVAVEAIALVAGGAGLGVTGHSEYTVAWFAGVVGVHFVAFGRLFWAGFYWLGVALLAGGIAGALVGFAGGDSGAIRAVSGLTASASLFVAGSWTVVGTLTGPRA
ncbi:MAG TPA: hypothetical protein VKV06_02395 [Acidimicrobiales bacterium]|nr:hypothetical protein [Acidimicrobiales bacterium]